MPPLILDQALSHWLSVYNLYEGILVAVALSVIGYNVLDKKTFKFCGS
jgi:hypothetical protein